jgi:hypothetical protein
MRCVFCKTNSSRSKSREHIIPESLGNISHILPPGVVCDSCNNYFSREVEKPFLDSDAVRLLRLEQSIPSKKGKIPSVNGVIEPIHANATLTRFRTGGEWTGVLDVPYQAIPSLLALKEGKLLFPASAPPPSDRIVSRFLAKVAIEVVASRLLAAFGDAEHLVDEQQLDLIRDHARRGMHPDWPFHVREIYNRNKKWTESDGRELQTVHEYDLLMTTWGEIFFVVAIFGAEFTINYGGPEIDGYRRWLCENNDRSPLYPNISLESLS